MKPSQWDSDSEQIDIASVVAKTGYLPLFWRALAWTHKGETRHVPWSRLYNLLEMYIGYVRLQQAGRLVDIPPLLIHWSEAEPAGSVPTEVILNPAPR